MREITEFTVLENVEYDAKGDIISYRLKGPFKINTDHDKEIKMTFCSKPQEYDPRPRSNKLDRKG